DCGPDHGRRQTLRLAQGERVTHVHVGSFTGPLPCCGNGESCGSVFLPPNSLTVATKNTGTKKMANSVADSMPPRTPVPIAFWPPEPAPLEIASGSTPSM